MKKNNLIPIFLVAGAGFAAYMYFKNKNAAKDISKGVDIAELDPTEKQESLQDQSTTTSEEKEPGENKIESYIKTGTSILKTGKQLIRGRKKRKSKIIIEPTESSNTPFAETAITRKNRKLTKRTTRKTTRTAKRSSRKNKKVVTGFEF